MNYDVSIVVPVYNVSRFIERCLHSLFGQTYRNIQFVFIDDCTPDNSIEILHKVLEQYPQRKNDVKVISHEKNRGLAAARNTGVENADGEYIQHIDSDDYVDTKMIEEMFTLAKKENADIVVCDIMIQWENTQKVAKQNFESKDKYLSDLLNTTAMPGVVNKLIRKKLYTDNDIYPLEGINLGEDYITTPRLVFVSEVISKIDYPFYHYVQYNEGSYTAVMSTKSVKDLKFGLNFLYEYFKETTKFISLKNDLLKGQLIKKLDIIAKIDKDRRASIFEMFEESNIMALSTPLAVRDRVIFRLCKKNHFTLLDFFLTMYGRLFGIVQRLKGR